MDQWLVIGVSGITCGGKTTLADNLYKHFSECTKKPFSNHHKKNLKIGKVHLINQDTYFLPEEDERHVRVEQLNHINWEIISSMDMKRMCKDIMEILGPKFILYPTKQLQQEELMHVDDNLFSEHHLSSADNIPSTSSSAVAAMQQNLTSTSSSLLSNKTKPNEKERRNTLNILIIEGFLIFNHTFTRDLCNIKFHLHLPYERCYERRQKRTYDPPDVLGYFEMVVWPMYEQHCKDFANRPDIMYLNGEVPRDKIFDFVLETIKEQL